MTSWWASSTVTTPSGSWADLRERFARFGLELHDEKTRLIEFGRFAAERRRARGLGKPETFDFLGFTHTCAKTRQTGRFALRRVTSKKRLRAKLRQVKAELMRRRDQPIPEQGQWLASVVRGHCSVLRRARQHRRGRSLPRPGSPALANGASAPQPAHQPDVGAHGSPRQPDGYPPVRILHPWPERALRRQNPRQEPSALDAHAGICAGGGRQRPSLPR